MKKTSEAVEKNFVNSKMCSSEIDESGKKRSSYRIGACGDGSSAVKINEKGIEVYEDEE